MKQQLYADLPIELHEADDLLHRYGRWAMDRRSIQRCGSAEGRYQAPQDDEDRQPRESLMSGNEVEAVRRALLAVDTVARTVLIWLYVPDGRPIGMKMRLCKVSPTVMREKHLEGVRAFWAAWGKEQNRCKNHTVVMDSLLV